MYPAIAYLTPSMNQAQPEALFFQGAEQEILVIIILKVMNLSQSSLPSGHHDTTGPYQISNYNEQLHRAQAAFSFRKAVGTE